MLRPTLLGALGVLLTTTGCPAQEEPCTLVGPVEGIVVELAPDLYERGSRLTLEVCTSDRCATAGAPVERHAPTEPGVWFTPEQLGGLGPGRVKASASLVTRDGRSSRWREPLDLVTTYPNGRRCDGEGFVQGTLRLDRAGRVSGPISGS